jgi:hypothetical protein
MGEQTTSWVGWGLAALLCLGFHATAIAQGTGGDTYTITEDGSLLYVQIYNDPDTLGSRFAHNHVIRAGGFDGQVRFDAQRPRSCELALRVPARELVVDEAWLREQVGYDKSIGDDDRKEVRGSMLDEGQLNAAEHPAIELRASDCRPVGESDVYEVRLSVEVRGEAATRRVRVQMQTDGDELTARSAFNMEHADFGMEPYSAFLGAVKNAEPIRFVARIVAKRAE